MTSRTSADPSGADPAVVASILRGLRGTPRALPSLLLYDDLGSALFEAITLLPEYEVARADERLILAHRADVLDRLHGPLDVVELGPGGGRKAMLFLTALCARQPEVSFAAVDVSPSALEGCKRTLEALPGVRVRTVVGTYLDGLALAPRPKDTRRWVLFLGSNLSNFGRRESVSFLQGVRATLLPGDALLLATDLGTAPERLVPAYDDALGVTAAFNRNVLVRLNREFGGDFDLDAFAHEARWNAPERRIEMHLVARRACEFTVCDERFHIDAGASIWTESSHRFDAQELRVWADETGFDCAAQWIDPRWPFAHSLFIAR